MKDIPSLCWLYDVALDEKGLRFVLFKFWTVYLLKFENIESVVEMGPITLSALAAYNFKNRFWARCFLITTKRGWFTRKVLITPKSPAEFLAWLKSNAAKVSIEEIRHEDQVSLEP